MSPDPITIEILRNAFIMAAEEMNAALIRSAYTPVIYESKDCAVALIDSHHRVLGQSSGVPLFLGNLEACTLATEQMFGRSVWGEGDIWIMNDPYLTGTHMHDVTVFAPSSIGEIWRASPPPALIGWTSAPRTRECPWTPPRSSRRESACRPLR